MDLELASEALRYCNLLKQVKYEKQLYEVIRGR
jgi:hypothetical protein